MTTPILDALPRQFLLVTFRSSLAGMPFSVAFAMSLQQRLEAPDGLIHPLE